MDKRAAIAGLLKQEAPASFAERFNGAPAPVTQNMAPANFNERFGGQQQHHPHRGVVDKLLGIHGPRYKTWPERTIVSGFSLPHDVYTGKVPEYVINPKTHKPELNKGIVDRAGDLAALYLAKPTMRDAVAGVGFAQASPEGGNTLRALLKI